MTGAWNEFSGEWGDHPDGVTPLDISGLPEAPRRVLMGVLHEQSASPDGVAYETLHALHGTIADLDALLHVLVQLGWLSAQEIGSALYFRVRLRPKRGSGPSAIWDSLNDSRF